MLKLSKKQWSVYPSKISLDTAYSYVIRAGAVGIIIAMLSVYYFFTTKDIIFIFQFLIVSFLTIGIFKKNIYCAIILFSYYALNFLYLNIAGSFIGTVLPIILSTLFILTLYYGIVGILRYRKEVKNPKRLFHWFSFGIGIFFGIIISLIVIQLIMLIPMEYFGK